ncbi:MAG: trehalase family glycosidase [Gemmatimonadota bacterium]|nr:trehalase family glycosidase [Gemmatimonadota bacterium]
MATKTATADFGGRLDRLSRPDKWYLAGGDGILWAPPFPKWLDRPGFWDEAMVYYHELSPLFTVALVDPKGCVHEMHAVRRTWRPDKLVREWSTGEGLLLRESQSVLSGGRFISTWTPIGSETWKKELACMHLVAFSGQPDEDAVFTPNTHRKRTLEWSRILTDRRGERMDVHMFFDSVVGSGAGATKCSIAAHRSEGVAYPDWRCTPFFENWTEEQGLKPRVSAEGAFPGGTAWFAVSCVLQSEPVTFQMRVVPQRVRASKAERSMKADATDEWREFFAGFPEFTCSDSYFERYYDYRIFGLGLNRLGKDAGRVKFPAIAEGIGYFHVPITYSAQCHMWEMRWHKNSDWAKGSLLNFIEHQKHDGGFHGRLYTKDLHGTDFYHANWGDALLAVMQMRPDKSFARAAYRSLSRYAKWLDRTRDRERSGMYDVLNHFETGQEYMSRYQAVDRNADARGWKEGNRLKGIDVTVYAYQLNRALGLVADLLGDDTSVWRWHEQADRIGLAIDDYMWDEAGGLYSDVDPTSFTRTKVRAGVCFYPMMTDIPTEAKLERMLRALEDPDDFNTSYPVPSSSVSDPLFSAEPNWKGKRHNCPWNGRVWPMVNSHIVEGLIRQWHAGKSMAGPAAARLLQKFIRMMFFDGDVDRPNCFEHYNPNNGKPSVYRGIDDYQHSWVLDLLIRGVAGIEPRFGQSVLVHPLPLGDVQSHLANVEICGRRLSVERSGAEVIVDVDGKKFPASVDNPITISLI